MRQARAFQQLGLQRKVDDLRDLEVMPQQFGRHRQPWILGHAHRVALIMPSTSPTAAARSSGAAVRPM
ncbi:MAG: hypothetical protein WCB44_29585, partial [Stellaceae bacterium]